MPGPARRVLRRARGRRRAATTGGPPGGRARGKSARPLTRRARPALARAHRRGNRDVTRAVHREAFVAAIAAIVAARCYCCHHRSTATPAAAPNKRSSPHRNRRPFRSLAPSPFARPSAICPPQCRAHTPAGLGRSPGTLVRVRARAVQAPPPRRRGDPGIGFRAARSRPGENRQRPLPAGRRGAGASLSTLASRPARAHKPGCIRSFQLTSSTR